MKEPRYWYRVRMLAQYRDKLKGWPPRNLNVPEAKLECERPRRRGASN